MILLEKIYLEHCAEKMLDKISSGSSSLIVAKHA
jgi:hypothetical protein